jgi:hypothetical protein
MSFAIFAVFGVPSTTTRGTFGQRFDVYSKLCNKCVGSIVLGNTFGNPEFLKVELHRQVHNCLSSKETQEETQEDKFQILPSKCLQVYVGQTKLEECTLSLSSLSQGKISFMWDMRDYANDKKHFDRELSRGALCYKNNVAEFTSEPKPYLFDMVRDAHTVHYKKTCLNVNSLQHLKKLRKLQHVYITNASFTIMSTDAPLWTLLPTNLTDLYVSAEPNHLVDLILKGIHNFSRLSSLGLSVRTKHITHKLGGMTSLKRLDLSNNIIKALPSLKRLVQLEDLDVSNNPTLCCKLDLPCTKLTRVDISYCDFDASVLDDLQACTSLRTVLIHGNHNMAGSVPTIKSYTTSQPTLRTPYFRQPTLKTPYFRQPTL